MEELSAIRFNGPFQWNHSDQSKTGRTSPDFGDLANCMGVYLWTVEVDGKELIHYVGHTSQNFRKRHQQHCSEFVRGNYGIYDAEDLKGGVRTPRFRGIWNVKGDTKKQVKSQFIRHKPDFLAMVGPYLDTLKVWVAPLSDPILSRRLETAIFEKIINEKNCRSHSLLPSMESHTFYHSTASKVLVKLEIPVNFDCLTEQINI
jgi:hypothetical protein